MKKATLMLAVLAMTGCMSPQMANEIHQGNLKAKENLVAATKNNSFECQNKSSCDKAFSLTKIYINENSDMRVQQTDETTVTTFGPRKFSGNVGINATRMPGKGESATITIIVVQDKYADDTATLRRVADIYNGFKPFIESKLMD